MRSASCNGILGPLSGRSCLCAFRVFVRAWNWHKVHPVNCLMPQRSPPIETMRTHAQSSCSVRTGKPLVRSAAHSVPIIPDTWVTHFGIRGEPRLPSCEHVDELDNVRNGPTPVHHGGHISRTRCKPCVRNAPCVLWCRKRDSNPRPTDYKSVALPAELFRLFRPAGQL